MFGARKYTPLPSNANGTRRKQPGVLSAYKKYAIVAVLVIVVFVIGSSGPVKERIGLGGYTDSVAIVGEDGSLYTPEETDGGVKAAVPQEQGNNDEDYVSPPFRPVDSELGSSDDSEEEETVHILPVGHSSPESEEDTEDVYEEDSEEAATPAPDFEEVTDDESTSGVSSFETDPDAASTTACSTPHDADKPLVQYALTIDAGSTGSRIHVYKFHNCLASPTLEYETFMSVQPGLSAFAGDPTAAAASLDPLMKEAVRVVPKSLQKCSNVEVKATAGLRLLGARESEAILDEVRNRLETDWPFKVAGEHGVEIMDGKDEGVYAWITANYLLGKIGLGATSTDTLAVMDLGGASTQIVFEPTFPEDSPNKLAEGDHKYHLKFGGKDFTLYQHSYLGYGLMRARRSVHNLVAFTWSFSQPGAQDWEELDEQVKVPNPCLAVGTSKQVTLDPPGRAAVNVTMHGVNGGFEACNRVVELVMAKDAICEVKPCSFNGVYQPSIMDTFPSGRLLALSYFTDRIKPLLPAGKASSSLTIGHLRSLAQTVCAGPDAWPAAFKGNDVALAELADRPEYCLDLTFIHALLGLGYELSDKRELVIEKKLKGVELGWALGAGLAMVENAELTCDA